MPGCVPIYFDQLNGMLVLGIRGMLPSVLLPHRRRILGEVDQEADQWSMLVVTPVMGYSLLFSCGRLNAFDPFAQADDRVSTVFCMPSHSYCFSYFFKLYRCCSGSLDLDLPCRFFRLCHFS
jgi:hypothetical protein